MVRLGFAISNDSFLVMPKFPIDTNFYHKYNAMIFVNEPPQCVESFWNPVLQTQQHSGINVLAFTNTQWQTIDYVAATDIPVGTELLVHYGDRYKRDHY